MGQEFAKKWAKRHPKGAANPMHSKLLEGTCFSSDREHTAILHHEGEYERKRTATPAQ
jgi:hypothetical protein